jgi:tetratricopeptide (TPR) repeat protein
LRLLEDLSKRMKYASLAPMLEMLEKIEVHATDYFHFCSEQSGHNLDEEIDEEIELSDPHGGAELTDESSAPDTGKARHKRSITVSSDTGHDRDSDFPNLSAHQSEHSTQPSVSIHLKEVMEERSDHRDYVTEIRRDTIQEEHPEGFEASHGSLPLKSGEDSHISIPLKGDGSEGSMSYLHGLQKSYQGDRSFLEKSGDVFEKAGETYSIAINNGSYVEGESEGYLSYDDSRRTSEYDDSRKAMEISELPGVHEEDVEYEEEEDYLEEEEPSEANVEDGHVLELEEKSDELSSVGESVPGIYGSDSDDDDVYDEEVEEIEIEDDEEDEERTESSDSDDELSAVTPPPSKPKSIFEKPNPKVEQFFDRLEHFFEVRRKTEERVAALDPSNKFKSLKVKNHSGGIVNKNGIYKKEYQQHDLNDKVVRNLDDLYDAAEAVQTELNYFLDQLVKEVKGIEHDNIIPPSLKPRDRAFEKAKYEYGRRSPGPPESWLYDVVRATIICKSYKQLSDVNKWLGKNCLVVQAKNRFAEPAFNGYRDLLFHVSIPFRDELAHICEIQVHYKDILAMNEQYGLPKHYEFFRSCFIIPWRPQDKTLEDLALMSKFGKIEGPLMKKLLKSKDPEQLTLVAGLCREKLDEFTRALELYRRVLFLQEDDANTDDEDIASTYLSIGLVLGSMGDTEESLKNLKKALEIQESCLGCNNVVVAESHSEIGHMLTKKGDYAGAISQFHRALVIREIKLGKDHFLVIKSL